VKLESFPAAGTIFSTRVPLLCVMSGFENMIFCESFSRQEWPENSFGSETSKLTCQTELIQSGWKVPISPNLSFSQPSGWGTDARGRGHCREGDEILSRQRTSADTFKCSIFDVFDNLQTALHSRPGNQNLAFIQWVRSPFGKVENTRIT
jgi:hypothetical protein